MTGYLYYVIPKGFFPQQDTGLILGITEAAQDTSFQAMAQRQLAAVKIILQDPAVATVGHNIGPGGPTAAPNQGRLFIALKPRDQRDASADQVITRLDKKLAAVEGIGIFMQPAQDITIGARLNKTQYQYTLTDADANELQFWASKFVTEFRKLSGVADVATDQESGGPMLNVTVNRDVASSFGILPSTIDNTLDDAFGQRIASTIFSTLNQYRVILEVAPKDQASPDTLSRIYVNSSAGQQVPLSTLVNSSITTAPLVINHQSLFPSVTISFNLKPGASLGEAVAAINDFAQRSGKPLSLSSTFQGNANAFASSLSGEPILILAALIVIYIILGVLYESVVHPITILSTLPSAGIGALLLLMAVHMDMSVIAMLGIILLIGIVKKNGIMLVDFALHAEKEEHLSSEESIYRAATLRFRPILMTTMAALLGGVPLMLGTGTGSEIRQPLGYTIVGGLLLSQLLTLYTTPVVYLYLDRLAGWLTRRRSKGTPEFMPAE
jgi:HAE1 family hydrophobic/amphiphilic exporter-1